jgi:hypothetical protein
MLVTQIWMRSAEALRTIGPANIFIAIRLATHLRGSGQRPPVGGRADVRKYVSAKLLKPFVLTPLLASTVANGFMLNRFVGGSVNTIAIERVSYDRRTGQPAMLSRSNLRTAEQ